MHYVRLVVMSYGWCALGMACVYQVRIECIRYGLYLGGTDCVH